MAVPTLEQEQAPSATSLPYLHALAERLSCPILSISSSVAELRASCGLTARKAPPVLTSASATTSAPCWAPRPALSGPVTPPARQSCRSCCTTSGRPASVRLLAALVLLSHTSTCLTTWCLLPATRAGRGWRQPATQTGKAYNRLSLHQHRCTCDGALRLCCFQAGRVLSLGTVSTSTRTAPTLPTTYSILSNTCQRGERRGACQFYTITS